MIDLTLRFMKLFDKRLTFDFSMIIVGSIISGLLELFGIMLILPFVQVAIDPVSTLENSNLISKLYELLGLASPSSLIYVIGLLCGASFILKDVYMLAFQHYQFSLVTRWRNELSEKFMTAYLNLNYRYHLRQASTSIINTLTSTVSAAVNGFLLQVLFIISYSIVAVFLILYMVSNFPEATIATSVCIFVLITAQLKMLKKANERISRESVAVKEENLGNLKQSIEAIKETKMFLRESFFSDLFRYSNRRVTENERLANLIQYIPLYLTEIIIILALIVMVCTSVYFNSGDGNHFAGLAILVAIAFRLTPVINRILTSYSQVRASMESVKVLIREFSEISTQQDTCVTSDKQSSVFKESISLNNVYFAYNDVDVLLNINVDIKKGEFVGVVGHSGSGKTTIVDILMGLLKPRQGKLLIDGKEATESDVRALRNSIGYVPQNPFIGDLSVKQNIAYGNQTSDIDEDRVNEVLKLVGLYEFFDSKPEKLNFKLGESGKRLSGGQKQRIAIARALYSSPEIIVLDEATSALDVASESEISKAISNLKGKTTIIAIAHRLSTIRSSDRIILVNWGEIEDTDSFESLVDNNVNFANLVSLSKL
ncbi:ABC transporter ATP-binding protein [Grimontia marina]|uniref:Multidrug resistance-like ATP-binding protein MdlB n=1 Tax=Grimontia marina TaxID=646534 RepID=A0A128ETN6_9GAMM|nr:ABC transporter ATP-binding protein [Grimontia marina]CZF77326.1 Heterocyst differentiation ATP-binding protein HepA [Grimontia marina]